jgi:acyl carrier protein phosphodiesterase
VQEKYAILQKNEIHLPERARYILPFMVEQNWLMNYAYLKPLAQIFERMDRRTNYQSGMKKAVETLEKQYSEIQNDFLLFMPELIDFVARIQKGKA